MHQDHKASRAIANAKVARIDARPALASTISMLAALAVAFQLFF